MISITSFMPLKDTCDFFDVLCVLKKPSETDGFEYYG